MGSSAFAPGVEGRAMRTAVPLAPASRGEALAHSGSLRRRGARRGAAAGCVGARGAQRARVGVEEGGAMLTGVALASEPGKRMIEN